MHGAGGGRRRSSPRRWLVAGGLVFATARAAVGKAGALLAHPPHGDYYSWRSRAHHACATDGVSEVVLPVTLGVETVGTRWGEPLQHNWEGCVKNTERALVNLEFEHGMASYQKTCNVTLNFTLTHVTRGYRRVTFALNDDGRPDARTANQIVVAVSNCSWSPMKAIAVQNGLRVHVRENQVKLTGQWSERKMSPTSQVWLWCFIAPHITFASAETHDEGDDAHADELPKRQPLQYSAQRAVSSVRDNSSDAKLNVPLHSEIFVLVEEIEGPAMWNMHIVRRHEYMQQFDAMLGGFNISADIYTGYPGFRYSRSEWINQLTSRRGTHDLNAQKQLEKLVLVVVSHGNAVNCRHMYLKQLIQAAHDMNVTVDSFGEYLPTNRKPADFPDRGHYLDIVPFSARYLFVWAIENANCPGYITEKLARPLLARAVPLVYAPRVDGIMVPDYDTLAPRGSYINVADFRDPWELVEYLIFLRDNPVEYAKYFRHVSAKPDAAVLSQIMRSKPWVFDEFGGKQTCAYQLAHLFHSLKGMRRPLLPRWRCLEYHQMSRLQCHRARIMRYLRPDKSAVLKAGSHLKPFSKCKLETHVDLKGGDIAEANPARQIRSLSTCADVCSQRKDCKTFTYSVKYGCYLKSSTHLPRVDSLGETISGWCK